MSLLSAMRPDLLANSLELAMIIKPRWIDALRLDLLRVLVAA